MKKLGKIVLGIISFLLVIVIGYVGYCATSYYRIDDNLEIETRNNQSELLKTNTEYSILTYNVGFGAYSDDYTFFLDSGVMEDGTVVSGKYGKGMSKDAVLKNTNGSKEVMKEYDADFYVLQEVDEDGSRSHHVNMYETYSNEFKTHGNAYAVNFHSAYLVLPIYDMHGKNTSGLLTLSKYKVASNVRKQYTVDTGFIEKLVDLDRCFMVSRIPVENGKELVIINSHMSAYDAGGLIRAKQLVELNTVMDEELSKGNYVIVGGDYNHDLVDSIGKFETKQQEPTWISTLTNDDIIDGMHIVEAINKYDVATCRAAEIPYEKGVNYEVVVDGFIVSDNISVEAYNVDTGYKYSDHNPVYMKFSLK